VCQRVCVCVRVSFYVSGCACVSPGKHISRRAAFVCPCVGLRVRVRVCVSGRVWRVCASAVVNTLHMQARLSPLPSTKLTMFQPIMTPMPQAQVCLRKCIKLNSQEHVSLHMNIFLGRANRQTNKQTTDDQETPCFDFLYQLLDAQFTVDYESESMYIYSQYD